MPDFPRYQSKANITSQQPSVEAPQDNTPEVLAKAGNQIGGAIQENALRWTNAVDTIQKTKATANFKTGLLDITNRAQNDPNYNNSDQYFKEIEKLKTDSLKGFQSKTAETEMGIELGYESKVAQIQIDNLYKKKMIDVGQAATLELLDLESQNPSEGMEQRIKSVLDAQVQAGVIGHKDAYELQTKYVKQGKYNAFRADLNTSPAVAEANLSKNLYGFDLKELSDAKKILSSESEKIQASTQNQVLTSYLNGDSLSTKDIKSLLTDGKIDAKFAESMITKIEDRKPDKISQDKAYIEFQNRGADALAKGDKATTQEIVRLMSDTMQAHAQGLLDKDDVHRILKDRNELIQKKLEKVSEDILSKKNPKNFMERISFWSDEYANEKPEIKARMYRKLIDGMMDGKDPDVLLSNVINEEMDIKLSENLKAPDRMYAVNPDTQDRIYSDDGGATWFDNKTGKEIK